LQVTNETGGNATHLDMTPSTFSKLTDGYSGGGVDGIVWEWVVCPIATTTGLWIRMHGGASRYWVALTVENARERTEKVEVSTDEGATWTATTLNNWNIYVLDGALDTDTAWMRVTSVTGSQVIVKDVDLASGTITKATSNYA
jgi:expansin